MWRDRPVSSREASARLSTRPSSLNSITAGMRTSLVVPSPAIAKNGWVVLELPSVVSDGAREGRNDQRNERSHG